MIVNDKTTLCENCTHKDVCKYADARETLLNMVLNSKVAEDANSETTVRDLASECFAPTIVCKLFVDKYQHPFSPASYINPTSWRADYGIVKSCQYGPRNRGS